MLVKLPTESDRPETVILADGDYPSGPIAAALLRQAAHVICCDGAALGYIRQGGHPHAIVGDGDSLPAELLVRYAGIIHRETEQDTNDLSKAVRFCLAEGLRSVIILGATGRREDHTIGNISLLADFRELGAEARMVTDYGVFDPMSGETTFACRAGNQVSIFTLDPAAEVSGSGLKYALPDRFRSWWCGTLNEATGDTFTIRTSGPAIVYRLF